MTTNNEPGKLIVQNEQVPALPQSDVERFIMTAIEKNLPVETMEKLLSMRRDLRAEQGKAAFDEAMAGFQSTCPIISKDKKVEFTSSRTGRKTSYAYAPLEVIISQVKDLLKTYGFSYSVTAEITPENWVSATCTAKHIMGHQESSSFRVPIDKEAFMNAQQQVAAALTYAKRYAFCNAFGIMTGDQDDDAHGADTPEQKHEPEKKTAPPSQPAQGAASSTTDGEKGTSTGFVSNITPGPVLKNGGRRYKIELKEHGAFYTFSESVAKYADKYSTQDAATISWHKGKFGRDIDTLTFPNVEFEQFLKESESK